VLQRVAVCCSAEVHRQYTIQVLRGREARPLHFYSYYGGTTDHEWDLIVRSHVGGLVKILKSLAL